MNDNERTVEQLKAIQAQLAVLQADYENIVRTYYNMFYNTTPMEITLKIYNEDGAVQTIKVPNRAADTSGYTKIYHGNPQGHVAGRLGEICLDTDANNLYYNVDTQGSEGWVEIRTMENFAPGREYLAPNGEGGQLINLNAEEVNKGILSPRNGGTGLSEFSFDGKPGILMGIPAVYNEAGEIVEDTKIVAAKKDLDYATPQTFTGVICYLGVNEAPPGFLVCDGKGYPISYHYEGQIVRPYGALYDHLTLVDDGSGSLVRIECPFGEYEEFDAALEQNVRKFRVPNLINRFIRGWDFNLGGRALGSYEEDAIPNIKGTWAQEITGVIKQFTGAISVAKDADGNPKMVPGSTSAPGGTYDYLINFNASDYHKAYKDNVDEVRVKNLALLPVIKY